MTTPQQPPLPPVTLGQLRQSTAYIASDTQVNITLRPKSDTAQDFPVTMIAYDRGVGVLDLIVDMPEGVSLLHANQAGPEIWRKEGIDAFDAGVDRGANPYSWEASRAWDSGWMQAQQAQIDTLPEITTPNTAWIAGSNAPGDLPLDICERFASWWAAKEYLDKELMDAAIDALDDGRNDDADRHHEARTDLANAEDGEGWCMLVCGQLWWLNEIADHG